MNLGATFVKNYIVREWTKHERHQDIFTILPDEKDMSHVNILYSFKDTALYAGLELVFQIILSEDHPYIPPSIKVFTPNARTKSNERLCIDGLTAYHPESWSPVATFRSIIERFISVFIDTTEGVGFYKEFDAELNARCIANSKAWNAASYPDLVAAYKDQCDDYVAQKMFDVMAIKETSAASDTIATDEYIYSDEE